MAVSEATKLLFFPSPEPPTPLGRYRVLAPSAAIRVSPLQLGTMSLGNKWDGFGNMTKERAFEILDAYFDGGGNFFDTGNAYHMGQSEEWLGEWMEKRGVRDQCVVATKFTANHRLHDLGKGRAVNFAGNSRASLYTALRDSLRKLRTDRVDILYVHWWDYTTSIEELMNSLHTVVEQSKVLYLGASNTPAWVVAAANTYARDHGRTPFSIYQGQWSLVLRDLEREILPMARQFGMAVAPYGVAGSGKFKTAAQIVARRKRGDMVFRHGANAQTEDEAKVSAALEEVAKEIGDGVSLTAVALAWVLAKAPYVFPVVGGRSPEHLLENAQALKIRLTEEQIRELEGVKEFDLGWPNTTLGGDPHVTGVQTPTNASTAQVDFVLAPKAVGYA